MSGDIHGLSAENIAGVVNVGGGTVNISGSVVGRQVGPEPSRSLTYRKAATAIKAIVTCLECDDLPEETRIALENARNSLWPFGSGPAAKPTTVHPVHLTDDGWDDRYIDRHGDPAEGA